MTRSETASGSRFMGQRIKRREDPRLLRGQGCFVDDVSPRGLLHVAFKRSDIAHGRIVSIDASSARVMDGVEGVYTGDDLRNLGLGPIPLASPFPAVEHFAVTPDVARYVGDPVAVVVAADRYVAADALAAIVVEYEPLPVFTDAEAAVDVGIEGGIHPSFPGNIALHLPAGTGVNRATREVDDSAWDSAVASADVVIRQRMVNQRVAPTCMEGRGLVADWDAGREELTIWASTQVPHGLRNQLATALALGQHQLHVIAPDVGGGFGAKKVHAEDFVCAFLSRHLGRPLKWVEDRSEAFMTTPHGRGVVANVAMAARRDGKVLGVKLRMIADIGAYQTMATAMVPTLTHGMLSGCYDFPVVRSDLFEVFTNKMSTDAYRGAGRPEGIYFIERAMDMLARELDLDPAELRRRNFIQPHQFPFLTQAGNRYDSGEYERALDLALKASDWDRLTEEREAAREEGRVVGLGLSMYVEICGHAGWEHGSVAVRRDGKVVASVGSTAQGQGHETTFAQLIADEFGIPMDDVRLNHGDTNLVKEGVGTFGSRSQVVGGTALLNASRAVKAKMATFAAQLLAGREPMLTATEEDLVFANGTISVPGHPETEVSFAALAAYAHAGRSGAGRRGWPDGLEAGLSADSTWEPEGATFPFGCHISMVEIDRQTGELQLLKMLCVDDAGFIVNPLIVEGQVHGGLAQGIGQAWCEEVVYDEDGQLVTGSFMDYAMPRAIDFPRFELLNTVTLSPLSPLGTKGIGEAGTIGSAPCIVNAVVDALGPFGVRHIDMSLRPEKLWAAINHTGVPA